MPGFPGQVGMSGSIRFRAQYAGDRAPGNGDPSMPFARSLRMQLVCLVALLLAPLVVSAPALAQDAGGKPPKEGKKEGSGPRIRIGVDPVPAPAEKKDEPA